MLQRIHGTAWESKVQLEAYYHLKEEAAWRDHRKLGQELDLFSIQDSAGGGVGGEVRSWTYSAYCIQDGRGGRGIRAPSHANAVQAM